MNKVVYS